MLVLEEKINASNKSVAECITRRDESYVAESARTRVSNRDKIWLFARQGCNRIE